MSANVVSIAPPELESKALTWTERAREIKIADQATHDSACEMLLGVKALLKEVDEIHDPAISAAHASHKAALAAKAKVSGPLIEAEKILKGSVWTWEREQQFLEEKRQREAREEADRLQREQTARDVEAARLASEQAAAEIAKQAEHEIEIIEAAGAPPEQVTEIIQRAEQKTIEIARSSAAEIQTITRQAEMQPAPREIFAPSYTRTKGVGSSVDYRAEVFDAKALCLAVANGSCSIELIQPNMPVLHKMASALKGTMQIPGVRVIEQPRVAVRTSGR